MKGSPNDPNTLLQQGQGTHTLPHQHHYQKQHQQQHATLPRASVIQDMNAQTQVRIVLLLTFMNWSVIGRLEQYKSSSLFYISFCSRYFIYFSLVSYSNYRSRRFALRLICRVEAFNIEIFLILK